MFIYTIWAQSVPDGSKWLIDAWDEDSRQDNPSGWKEALESAYESTEGGAQNVRVVRSSVSMEVVEKAFDFPTGLNNRARSNEDEARIVRDANRRQTGFLDSEGR